MRRLVIAVITATCVVVSTTAATAAPPRSITDACPTAHVPEATFTDIRSSAYSDEIHCVVWWQVAQGRTTASYDPATDISRAQMATFLSNLITRSGGTFPESIPDAFDDDNGGTHEDATNRVAAAGITMGKTANSYDPHGRVTRSQMASFLVRAAEYRTGTALPSNGDAFSDDNGSTHEASINKLAAAGAAVGTSGESYVGTRNVVRDEMAGFVVRILDLLVEGGVPLPALPPATVGYDLEEVANGTTRSFGWRGLDQRTKSISGVQYELALASPGLYDDKNSTHAIFAEYDLARAYERLTVTIGQADDAADADDLVRFTVYGDGEQLATETLGFGEAVPLDLDVSGVLRLRFEMANTSTNNSPGTAVAVWGDPTVSG